MIAMIIMVVAVLPMLVAQVCTVWYIWQTRRTRRTFTEAQECEFIDWTPTDREMAAIQAAMKKFEWERPANVGEPNAISSHPDYYQEYEGCPEHEVCGNPEDGLWRHRDDDGIPF